MDDNQAYIQALTQRLGTELQANIQLQTQFLKLQKELEELKKPKDAPDVQ